MNPFAYHASLHPWQFFVTLTYGSGNVGGRVPKAAIRKQMLFSWLRRAALGGYRTKGGDRLHSCEWHNLLWLAREEQGEKGGRHHFHILLGGLPPQRHNVTEAHRLDHFWSEVGGGISDVRMYDPGLDAVSYVMKGLEQWSFDGANSYEVSKFDDKQGCELILSDSCVRAWSQALRKWAHRAKAARASSRTGTADFSGRSLPAVATRRKRKQRAKETSERELRAGYGYGMHPAGVSFVR